MSAAGTASRSLSRRFERFELRPTTGIGWPLIAANRARFRLGTCSALLILTFTSSAMASEHRQVLLLHSFARESATLDAFIGLFRTELSRQSPDPIDFLEVSLQPGRFRSSPEEGPIVNYLQSTLAGHPLDLVVSIGGPAAVFAHKYRHQIFPTTPLLMAAVDQRLLEGGTFAANETAVAVANDPSQIIGNILDLLPETTHLFVVIGTSRLEQFWRDEVNRASQPFKNRLTVVSLDDLSFAEMLQRCATLPPRSAIFYALLSVDAKGVPQEEERALADLHAVANAPIFGVQSSQLGRGVVGGPVMSIDTLSRNAANVGLRILRGESPGNINSPVQIPGPPTFDWRELRRWSIGENRLPAGSLVLFRQPTALEQYYWPMFAGAAIGLAETLLIGALVAIQIKQRRTEHSLRESEHSLRQSMIEIQVVSTRLNGIREQERARMARDIHDGIGQSLTALKSDVAEVMRRVKTADVRGSEERLTEMSALIDASVNDVRRIATELRPPILDDSGIVAAIRAYLHDFSYRANVPCILTTDLVDFRLPDDRATALFRILQEALTNVVRHAEAGRIDVALSADATAVRLIVHDDGRGIRVEEAQSPRALGLVGMHDRARLCGGDVAVSGRPGEGTTISTFLPLGEMTL
jgi:signal transduction histidine kinase